MQSRHYLITFIVAFNFFNWQISVGFWKCLHAQSYYLKLWLPTRLSLSPLLFIMCTDSCTNSQWGRFLVKFSDDTGLKVRAHWCFACICQVTNFLPLIWLKLRNQWIWCKQSKSVETKPKRRQTQKHWKDAFNFIGVEYQKSKYSLKR